MIYKNRNGNRHGFRFVFLSRQVPIGIAHIFYVQDLSKETNKILNRRQRSPYFPDVGLSSQLFL